MPVHDWTRVAAGIFHDFHHEWISEIKRALNRELQGTEYYALAEQVVGSTGPEVLTLQRPLEGAAATKRRAVKRGGTALATHKPKVRFHIRDEKKWYTERKKAVTIRHVTERRIVAVFEVVSPGNKSSRSAIAAFIRKTQDLLSIGLHLAFADLFPPSPRDPQWLHPLIWGDDEADTFRFERAKPLTCASWRHSHVYDFTKHAFDSPKEIVSECKGILPIQTPK